MKPKCWSHPKFATLKMRLRTSKATTAGILEGLWHLTATFEPGSGRVPFSAADLMNWLELDETLCGFKPDFLLESLIQAHFVDCRDGLLVIHDWEDHKPTYLNDRERQRRHRSKVSRDCHVTVCDNNAPSDSDSDSEHKSISKEIPTGLSPLFVCRDVKEAYLTQGEVATIQMTLGNSTGTAIAEYSSKTRRERHPTRPLRANLVKLIIQSSGANNGHVQTNQRKPTKPFQLEITDGSDQC